MLRAVLLGMLAVTSVVACKSEGGTSAKSQPGVAAGKVVEVKGAVTVKHGDASRPLAAGETVEGDDVVTTGADGNVVIELAHNLVRWELGPNKTQKVNESIAFKAAKNTGPVAAVDQDTAAAGRPAERSAVGTTATEVEEAAKADAEEPPAAEAPAPPPPPAAAAPAAEPAEPRPEGKRSRSTRSRRESMKEAAPEIPSAEAAMAPRDDAPPADGLRTTRGATRGPMVAKPVPPQAPMAPPTASSGMGVSGTGVSAGGGVSTRGIADINGPLGSSGAGTPSALVAQKQPALKACLKGQTEPVTLLVTVTNGKPTVQLTSKAAISASLDACVKKVIGSISFTANGKVTTSIKP